MNKFTDSQNLPTRKTPPVVFTESDHVVARRVYTESLKTTQRLKSMEYYKTDLPFQRLFKNMKYYTKFPKYDEQYPNNRGIRSPDIPFNEDYWYERYHNDAWIGLSHDKATN